jgi:hypothetical protein
MFVGMFVQIAFVLFFSLRLFLVYAVFSPINTRQNEVNSLIGELYKNNVH